MNEKRENFTGNLGFILSCVGAALGLGNIWMFSYRLGQYGGAAFLIPYFIFVFILGTAGLIIEFAFGRRFKSGSLLGIKKVFKEKKLKGGSFIGSLPVVGLFGVLMFYSVVIGWILKYFFLSVTGEISTIDTSTFFDNFAGTTSTIPWVLLSIFITLTIVFLGVTKGIEKLNKIAMPVLLFLFVILTIRSLTLPNSMEGVKYLLTPRWEHLLNSETWIMALGQAFFTVSLNGCGMVVYGSYTNKKFNIPSAAFNTAIFDTIAALLASFMIMPAVFSFGLDPAAGPSLLFITMPKIFQEMPLGTIVSVLFFLSIIFAAISSSINMLEGPVEAFISNTKFTRKKATLICSITCMILAIPLATDIDLFNKFADFITIVISPLGALIVAVVFFYVHGSKNVMEEINIGAKKPIGNWFIILGKYIFVITTIIVIILGISMGGIG